MAIISTTKDYRSERSEDWAVYPVNQEAVSVVYIVQFDNDPSEAGKRTILAKDSAGIPRKWQRHPVKPWTFVKNRLAEPGNGAFEIIVTVNYETIEDPVNEPPVYEWLHAVSSEPKDTTIDGWAVVNSSQEAYDPSLNVDVYDQVLRVTRNEASFNAIYANSFIGTVNNTTFYSSPPGTVLCKVFDGRRARAADLFYWVVTYEFQFRVDEWRRRVRDEGFRIIDDTDSSGYKTLKDDDGHPLSQPVLLNGFGQVLPIGNNPYFWFFDFSHRSNFGQLGL